MKRRFLGPLEKRKAAKLMKRMLDQLNESAVFVEGKKDHEALRNAGILNVFEIAGKVRRAAEKNNAKEVVILTDLDESGDELALEAKEELERYGVKVDVDLRKKLGSLLNLRNFEEFDRKLKMFYEEVKE
ncbi:toprim domain-containing protein [Candidatus Micrarchaeota archaeon]|nr:toprim domain-containing protein [Candidatus Micrarchaeota archaeon]